MIDYSQRKKAHCTSLISILVLTRRTQERPPFENGNRDDVFTGFIHNIHQTGKAKKNNNVQGAARTKEIPQKSPLKWNKTIANDKN